MDYCGVVTSSCRIQNKEWGFSLLFDTITLLMLITNVSFSRKFTTEIHIIYNVAVAVRLYRFAIPASERLLEIKFCAYYFLDIIRVYHLLILPHIGTAKN